MAKKEFQLSSIASEFWKKMSDKGYKCSLKWVKAKVKRDFMSPKVLSKKGHWVVTYTK